MTDNASVRVNVGVRCLVGFCVCGWCSFVLVWVRVCGGFAVAPGVGLFGVVGSVPCFL